MLFFYYISLQGHCGLGQQIDILHFVFSISLHAVCTSVTIFFQFRKVLAHREVHVCKCIIGGIYMEWITLSKLKYNDGASFPALIPIILFRS